MSKIQVCQTNGSDEDREAPAERHRPDHAKKLKRQLDRLDEAKSPQDMNLPGWKLHPLHDDLEGHFAVWVNGNWRMTFTFEGTDAILVDYQDYN